LTHLLRNPDLLSEEVSVSEEEVSVSEEVSVKN